MLAKGVREDFHEAPNMSKMVTPAWVRLYLQDKTVNFGQANPGIDTRINENKCAIATTSSPRNPAERLRDIHAIANNINTDRSRLKIANLYLRD